MPEEMPIHHAARQLIERYGVDAPRQARIRADELAAAGDVEGRSLWRDIYNTVVELLHGSRSPKTTN